MKQVRGGAPDKPHRRGLITAAGGNPSVNTKSSSPLQGARAPRRDIAERLRQANRARRRQSLIDEDLRRHGSLGIRALLDGLELDYEIPDLDRRLERLINADPRSLRLLDLVGGPR
jgi:hypothetical protein